MMKYFFIAVMMIGLSGSGIFAQKSNSDSSNPGEVLKYTTAVTELNNLYVEALSRFEINLSGAAKNIQLIQQDKNAVVYPINCDTMEVDKKELARIQSLIKSRTSFDERSAIETAIKKAVGNSEKTLQACSNIDSYFTKGEYKEDEGFKNYLSLIEAIYGSIRNSYVEWSNVAGLASKVGAKAESDVLKNHKAAEFILPMKNDLTMLDEMFNMYSHEFVFPQEVRSRADAAELSINKNRNVSDKDLSKLKDPSYTKIYDSFYENADKCLKELVSALEKKSSFTPKYEEKKDQDGEQDPEKVQAMQEQPTDPHRSIGMETDFENARESYRAALNDYSIFIAQ